MEGPMSALEEALKLTDAGSRAGRVFRRRRERNANILPQ